MKIQAILFVVALLVASIQCQDPSQCKQLYQQLENDVSPMKDITKLIGDYLYGQGASNIITQIQNDWTQFKTACSFDCYTQITSSSIDVENLLTELHHISFSNAGKIISNAKAVMSDLGKLSGCVTAK